MNPNDYVLVPGYLKPGPEFPYKCHYYPRICNYQGGKCNNRCTETNFPCEYRKLFVSKPKKEKA